ncbi:MAG TPA: bifunctional 4-hydroxy-2-oxoglutarate aldolase/2-dehydro-3-deoxy-phosphogluconate aldolase [Propionicimonas sp.]
MNEQSAVGERPAIPAAISSSRVIAIGRRLQPAAVPAIGDALVAGGVRAFEITMNSEGAVEVIAALAARYAEDDLLVGAGTVLELGEAEAAIRAGARFLVMPHFDPVIVGWARDRGIAAFPGCFGPTEILAAWRAGAAAVKLFPASAVGPRFVRELQGPLPQIPLIPTGGVTIDNAAEFMAAGAAAIGMGSWLTGSGDPEVVQERALAITRVVAAAA